jgi:hypothetical protein
MGNIFINIPPATGGGDLTAAYLLVSGTQAGDLNFARTITAGPNIALIDGGPGGTLQISASAIQGPAGTPGAPGTSGDPFAQYVTMATTASLPNERVLTAGQGIQITDDGAGSTVTIAANVLGPPGNVFGGGINQISSNVAITGGGMSLVSTSVGPLTISLPVPVTSGTFIFKDCQGSASINPFTVAPTGGRMIDGISSSYAYYANFGALKLFTDGHDWFTW